MKKSRIIKKHYAAVANEKDDVTSIEILNWNGKYFLDGRRYGDKFIAKYFLKFDGPVPRLVKNEKFKPYRSTGWGGDDFDGHKGIDWEADEVKKALKLRRDPTEEEIKTYFEGIKVG